MVDSNIPESNDGLSFGPSLEVWLCITEGNDNQTDDGEFDGIFDGTLLCSELGTLNGNPLGSNGGTKLGPSLRTSELPEMALQMVYLMNILMVYYSVLRLVLLIVTHLDLIMTYYLNHHQLIYYDHNLELQEVFGWMVYLMHIYMISYKGAVLGIIGDIIFRYDDGLSLGS